MRDLNEVLDLTLKLPINGRTYEVQPPPAATGAHLMNLLALGIAADAGIPLTDEHRGAIHVDDDQMPDFARQCLGPVYEQMLADGLDHARIEFAVHTAFLAWTVGKEFAEAWWESGGKVGRPSRDQPPTGTPTRSAAAFTTKSSAFPTGTKTTRRKPSKGTRSR